MTHRTGVHSLVLLQTPLPSECRATFSKRAVKQLQSRHSILFPNHLCGHHFTNVLASVPMRSTVLCVCVRIINCLMTVSALSYLHSCHLQMVALMMFGNNKGELMRAHLGPVP